MISSSSLLFILLLITIPSALSSHCIPKKCSSGCCASKDTCAADVFGCNYCDPATCDSGACANNRCVIKASEATSRSDRNMILFALVGSFLAMSGVILIAVRNRQKNAGFARVFIEALSIEKVETAATAIVPIIEVETPKLSTETGELMENEERFAKGEEIPHNLFVKHMKEHRESLKIEIHHLDEENEGKENAKLDVKEIPEKADD